MLNLIDLSEHNGTADFKKIASDSLHIDGVILRAGYGRVSTQKDKMFERNFREAKAAGLAVGAYWYSYATSAAETKLEAKAAMRAIAGKTFELPVYFDIEDKRQQPLSKAVCSAMVRTFCDALEEQKYFAGVYSFDSFFDSNLDESIPKRYSAWVARVERKKPKFCKNYGAWQYSFQGRVDGVNGDVDLSECYVDFPKIIARANLK
jgi:GH25 family lysozyme M1 (1,4-beta-N-acetylmuramidase)